MMSYHEILEADQKGKWGFKTQCGQLSGYFILHNDFVTDKALLEQWLQHCSIVQTNGMLPWKS